MIHKRVTAKGAAAKIKDGDHVMVGGFLDGGSPQAVLREVMEMGQRGLTITSNDSGKEGLAIYDLISTGQVVEVNTSYVGANPASGQQMISGEIKTNLFPQGSLVEKIRAGGTGLGGVLTPVGLGTVVEEGKEKITVNGKEYLLELPLHANVAIVRAHVADDLGNLVIRGSSRNFNTVMPYAADYVIAEVDEVVPAGRLDPNEVTVPSLLIDAIVLLEGSDHE